MINYLRKINLVFKKQITPFVLKERILDFKLHGKNISLFVIYYHKTSNSPKTNLIPGLVNCSEEEFEKEILFFKKYFNLISLEDLKNYLLNNLVLPKNSLLITFDDGYKDNYTYAYQVLKRNKVPAAIFLTTDFIDNITNLIWTDQVAYIINSTKKDYIRIPGFCKIRLKNNREGSIIELIEKLKLMDDNKKNMIIQQLLDDLGINPDNIPRDSYLSTDEIMEMSRNKIYFGSHGCSHSILTRVDQIRAKNEIVNSKRRIEEITGKSVEFFAYPNGSFFDFNAQIIVFLKSAGYLGAFTTIPGVYKNSERLDNFSLKRIAAGRSLYDLKSNLFLFT